MGCDLALSIVLRALATYPKAVVAPEAPDEATQELQLEQTLIVALVVAAALLFLERRWLRTLAMARRPRDGSCAGGCGCGPAH